MVINLDFSKISIKESIKKLEESSNGWTDSFLSFLKEYNSSNTLEVLSSGTTGNRKSFKVSKEQMILSAEATIKFFNLKKEDKVLLNLSCNFIAGKMMMVRAIVGQLNLILSAPSSDPSEFITSQFDFVPLIPMQVKSLIQSGKLNLISKLLIGGGKVEKELIEALKDFKGKAFESFAMTETLTHFALRKLNPYEGWFTTIDGFKVDRNNNNELIILENNITRRKIETRDLIDLKSQNQFNWLGRSDNLINSGGIKIIPEIIETNILKHICCPFVIVGIPDEKLGQKVVLVTENSQYFDLNKLNSSLEKYRGIKEQFLLDSFPRTESGKIKRNEIVKIISA